MPPRWVLTLLALLAIALHVRPAQILLLVAAYATSCPPLSATDRSFAGRLAAFTMAASPLAAAREAGDLTTGEAAAVARCAAPLLSEAAWALDRLHGVFLTPNMQHGGAVLAGLLDAVALATRCGGGGAVSPLLSHHAREAVERRMLPHFDLRTTATRYDAVPILVEALGSILHDLPLEADVAPDLPEGLDLVEVPPCQLHAVSN